VLGEDPWFRAISAGVSPKALFRAEAAGQVVLLIGEACGVPLVADLLTVNADMLALGSSGSIGPVAHRRPLFRRR
jgi:hypothetical protein